MPSKFKVTVSGFGSADLAESLAGQLRGGAERAGLEVAVEEVRACAHDEYQGTGHCAEMSCPNYVNKHRSEAVAGVDSLRRGES